MVTNNYSMTEAGTAFTYMPPGEITRRPGSVGMPMAPTEVRIADADGQALPTGEVGEVLIGVGEHHREYYRDPDATARTWSGPWLRSGDLGRVDDDGYLYIVGRAKDVIIRGGNNIAATEVEAVLYEHAGVLEAAVVGIPHDVLGEDVGAFVVARPGRDPRRRRADRRSAVNGWPTTRCPAGCGSSTSCPATPPARCSSATCHRPSDSQLGKLGIFAAGIRPRRCPICGGVAA